MAQILNKVHIPAINREAPYQTADDIDRFFIQLTDNHIQQLVFYIHGGLNEKSYADGMAQIQEAQFQKSGRHTLSLIWETGVMETITSRVTKALDQPLIKKMFPMLEDKVSKYLKFSKKNQGEKGDGFEPVNENTTPVPPTEEELIELAQTLEDEFKQDLGFDNSLDIEIEQEITSNPHLSDDFYQDAVSSSSEMGGKSFGFSGIIPNPARILTQVTLSVLKRYANNTHHDVQETIVEELLREIYAGSFIRALWEDMKFRAKDMWEQDPLKPDGIARYFLQKLAEHQASHSNFRIDLIGHSAGSIVICNLLATAARHYKQLKFGSVIFLAPAATMEFFYDEIVTKPERYHKFHMFTMTDEQEKSDVLVKLARWNIYGYSLLYFVSGLLEPLIDQSLSGMMRYLTNEPPFDTHKLRRIKDFLTEDGEERLILSPGLTTLSGLQTQSKSHGGFSHDTSTINSILVLLDQPLKSNFTNR